MFTISSVLLHECRFSNYSQNSSDSSNHGMPLRCNVQKQGEFLQNRQIMKKIWDFSGNLRILNIKLIFKSQQGNYFHFSII